MNHRNFAENKNFCSLDLLDDRQLDNCFNDILNLFPKHDNALKICFLSSGNGKAELMFIIFLIEKGYSIISVILVDQLYKNKSTVDELETFFDDINGSLIEAYEYLTSYVELCEYIKKTAIDDSINVFISIGHQFMFYTQAHKNTTRDAIKNIAQYQENRKIITNNASTKVILCNLIRDNEYFAREKELKDLL